MTAPLSVNTSTGSVDLHRYVCRPSLKSIIRPLLRVYKVVYVPNAVIHCSGFQIMEYVHRDWMSVVNSIKGQLKPLCVNKIQCVLFSTVTGETDRFSEINELRRFLYKRNFILLSRLLSLLYIDSQKMSKLIIILKLKTCLFICRRGVFIHCMSLK